MLRIEKGNLMKRERSGKRARQVERATASGSPSKRGPSDAGSRRASIFRNGSNQAVRLPQEMRFADHIKEVRIRRQGGGLLISPIKPDWASFFAFAVDVPDDFLADRGDAPPQSREPL
jgi:antitoxin VapB